MASFKRHFHRCDCGRLRSCQLDCTLTDELVGGDGSDRPPGPRAHGGSGAHFVAEERLLCSPCDPRGVNLITYRRHHLLKARGEFVEPWPKARKRGGANETTHETASETATTDSDETAP